MNITENTRKLSGLTVEKHAGADYLKATGVYGHGQPVTSSSAENSTPERRARAVTYIIEESVMCAR